MVSIEALEILGTALGLTALAGINLYLTVFVTGLAIKMGWLTNYPAGLEVLGDPIVLIVAGVFLAVETIADKVPYVDNAWDAVHTLIRPVGGMLLALTAVGDVTPTAQVLAALMGGSVAFTSHSLKAGTRLMVNASPEPVSNIVLSTVEDGVVIAGTWLAIKHPIIAMVVVVVFLVAFWYSAPKFYRMLKAHAAGVWHRLVYWRRRADGSGAAMSRELPAFAHETWLMVQREDEQVAWAVPCYSGRMNTIGRHVRGCLVGTTDGRLFFMGRKNFRSRVRQLELSQAEVLQDAGLVFYRLTVKGRDEELIGLKFTRKHAGQVPPVVDWINANRGATRSAPKPQLTELDLAASAG